jgi:hypothetical protein
MYASLFLGSHARTAFTLSLLATDSTSAAFLGAMLAIFAILAGIARRAACTCRKINIGRETDSEREQTYG